jgi:cytochrome P450
MFEAFDHTRLPLGPDHTPYEYFERLRDHGLETGQQIGWSDHHGGFWVVIGYDAATEIYRNPSTFGSRQTTIPPYGTPRPLMLVQLDEPVHAKYRNLVKGSFSAGKVALLEEAIRSTTNRLIDGFIYDGAVDLKKAVANEIPARVTALLLGMSPEEGEAYRRWTHAMAHFQEGGDEAVAQVQRMTDHFHEMLAERRRNLGDDLFSMLIRSQLDDAPLSDVELFDFWIMVLLGGIDNSEQLLAAAFWRLSWDRELRRRLIAHPELLPSAIDELMRCYGPVVTCRTVYEPVSIAGVEMEPGQMLMKVLPVINRDPRQFEHPDVFLPERPANRHLGFGLGLHRCLGAHLTKLEVRVALEEILRRIPEFELDHRHEISWKHGQVFGIDEVQVVYPPGGGSTWPERPAALSAG